MKVKSIISNYGFIYASAFCSVIFFVNMLLYVFGAEAQTASGVCTAVSFIIVTVIYKFRKSTVMYICTGTAVLITAAVLAVRKIDITDIAFNAFKDFLSGESEGFQIIFICAVSTLILSMIFIGASKYFILRLAVSVIILFALIYIGVKNIVPNFSEIFSGITVIFLEVTEISIKVKYRNMESDKYKSAITFLVPIILLFSVGVTVIPNSEQPIKWEFVKNIAADVKSALETLSSKIKLSFFSEAAEFGISMQGYSDTDSVLGGNLIPSDARAMVIGSPSSLNPSYYLGGTFSSTYDGHGWSGTEYPDFGMDEYLIDYYETLYAFERTGFTEKEISEFAKFTSVSAEYDKIKTKTVFYPLKTHAIFIGTNMKYSSYRPSVKFDIIRGVGTRYSLDYLDINYNSDQFADTAKKKYRYSEKEDVKVTLFNEKFNNDIPENFGDILKKRSEYIYSHYTELPDSITERTFRLAEEITAGCGSDYEKLKAIEKYLRQYTYTLMPGDIPEGREPIDYFLFESREGYCTYFATAMAVLARCENIPVRYVQGYSMDIENSNPVYRYDVINSNAHAWPEAYIEGVGWVPFEPTSAYWGRMYEWKEKNANINNGQYKADEYNPYEKDDSVISPSNEPEESGGGVNAATYIIVFLCFALLVILIIIVYTFIRIKLLRRKYAGCTETEKVLFCFRLIIMLMKNERFQRENDETVFDFAVRADRVYLNSPCGFSEIADIFCKIRYGGREADDQDIKKTEGYLEWLCSGVRKSKNQLKTVLLFASFRI